MTIIAVGGILVLAVLGALAVPEGTAAAGPASAAGWAVAPVPRSET